MEPQDPTKPNQKYWFKAKEYGWGWYPSSRQGWLVMLVWLLAFTANVSVFMYQLDHRTRIEMGTCVDAKLAVYETCLDIPSACNGADCVRTTIMSAQRQITIDEEYRLSKIIAPYLSSVFAEVVLLIFICYKKGENPGRFKLWK